MAIGMRETHCQTISLGQGQGPIAAMMIDKVGCSGSLLCIEM